MATVVSSAKKLSGRYALVLLIGACASRTPAPAAPVSGATRATASTTKETETPTPTPVRAHPTREGEIADFELAGPEEATASAGLPDLDARLERVVRRPDVQRAFEQLALSVVVDADLQTAGRAALEQLSADPTIMRPLETLVGKLSQDPAVIRAVVAIMQQHPGMQPEEVTRRIGARFEEAGREGGRTLIEEPAIAGAIQSVTQGVGRNPHVGRAIAAAIATPRFARALTSGDAGAIAAAFDRTFSEERLARFDIEVASLPTVRKRLARLGRDVLASPALRRRAIAHCHAIVGHRELEARLTSLFTVVLEGIESGHVDAARLKAVLSWPPLINAMAGFVTEVAADPDVAALGDRALADITADASFRAQLERLMTPP